LFPAGAYVPYLFLLVKRLRVCPVTPDRELVLDFSLRGH